MCIRDSSSVIPGLNTNNNYSYPFLSYQHVTTTTSTGRRKSTNVSNTSPSAMPPISRLPIIPLPHSQGCTPADAVKVMGYLLSKSITAFIVCIERDQAGVMDPSPSSSRRRRQRRNNRNPTTTTTTESTLHVPLVEAFSDNVPHDHEDDDGGSDDGFHSLASVHSSDFNQSTTSITHTSKHSPNNIYTTATHHQDEDPFSPGESFLAIRISCSPVVSMEDVVRLGAVVGELKGNYGAVTILKEYLPSSA
eukprot:TRINITY_DN38159_c0_g1_i1.p1 TRINITY_DN38159_c0_g1~~TRINITY_DN38159_c0_g1_i1.p1  ORF type:complete len:249 (+),score=53.28 TRINITY_DN38159_c0_g1_i1:189-935(+)